MALSHSPPPSPARGEGADCGSLAAERRSGGGAEYLGPPGTRAESQLAAGSVEVVARRELEQLPEWRMAFAGLRKDHRYYELVEDTLEQEFEHRYFVVRDADGEVVAIQPFLLLDQDLLAAAAAGIGATAARVRRVWPRFLRLRTLMIGCAAGEGHLGARDGPHRQLAARLLADAVLGHARALGAPLIVLKEFPANDRGALQCFPARGFTRVPSLPMTRLDIDYPSFEAYLERALSRKTRRDLRRKFQIGRASCRERV